MQKPTNVICYDLNAGQKAVITSGTFINAAEDVIYVSAEANGAYKTFKINRHDWSDWTDTGMRQAERRVSARGFLIVHRKAVI